VGGVCRSGTSTRNVRLRIVDRRPYAIARRRKLLTLARWLPNRAKPLQPSQHAGCPHRWTSMWAKVRPQWRACSSCSARAGGRWNHRSRRTVLRRGLAISKPMDAELDFSKGRAMVPGEQWPGPSDRRPRELDRSRMLTCSSTKPHRPRLGTDPPKSCRGDHQPGVGRTWPCGADHPAPLGKWLHHRDRRLRATPPQKTICRWRNGHGASCCEGGCGSRLRGAAGLPPWRETRNIGDSSLPPHPDPELECGAQTGRMLSKAGRPSPVMALGCARLEFIHRSEFKVSPDALAGET